MHRSETNKTTDIEVDDLTIGPDIEVMPSSTDIQAVTLEPDLTLHIAPIHPVEPEVLPEDPEPAVLTTSPVNAGSSVRFSDRFGPQAVAGVVIVALVAIFATLMILGVGDRTGEEPSPVAPVVDIPVEIGEAVTLERE